MKNITLKNKSFKTFLDFLARVAISAIFISAIPGKISGFGRTAEYISSKGIPDPIASILFSWRNHIPNFRFWIFYLWKKSKN